MYSKTSLYRAPLYTVHISFPSRTTVKRGFLLYIQYTSNGLQFDKECINVLLALCSPQGPRDSDHVILCIHGEPTWSFLYRFMIKSLAGNGFRVIALDFIGKLN